LILNELFFYQLVLKEINFFVGCHLTLFKWIFGLCLKFMNVYCILFKFTIKICY